MSLGTLFTLGPEVCRVSDLHLGLSSDRCGCGHSSSLDMGPLDLWVLARGPTWSWRGPLHSCGRAIGFVVERTGLPPLFPWMLSLHQGTQGREKRTLLTTFCRSHVSKHSCHQLTYCHLVTVFVCGTHVLIDCSCL